MQHNMGKSRGKLAEYQSRQHLERRVDLESIVKRFNKECRKLGGKRKVRSVLDMYMRYGNRESVARHYGITALEVDRYLAAGQMLATLRRNNLKT